MAPYNGAPTEGQQIALALAPKIAASLSMAGSSYMMADILLLKRKRKRQQSGASSAERTTCHRLLFGLSLCDLLMSAGLFTSTWPMPAGTPHTVWAVGSTETCEAVGFLEQAGVAAVLYNASLSCYYLVRIRAGWTATRIARQLEPVMHAVPIVFGLVTMIASLQLDLFNSGLFDCWIAPYPQGCVESWRRRSSTDANNTTQQPAEQHQPCLRGDNASLYQWLFDLIPKWSSILLVTINMFLVHRAVYQQERITLARTARASVAAAGAAAAVAAAAAAASQNNNDDDDDDNNNNSTSGCSNCWRRLFYSKPTTDAITAAAPSPRVARRLARQSYLYVGALYITYIPVIITRTTELVAGHVYYGMLLTISITIPLQGLWNVIVYLRPRYLAQREAARKEQERKKRRKREEKVSSLASATSSSRFFLQFLKNVSQVVQEGALANEEEEDGDVNESTAAPDHAGGENDDENDGGTDDPAVVRQEDENPRNLPCAEQSLSNAAAAVELPQHHQHKE